MTFSRRGFVGALVSLVIAGWKKSLAGILPIPTGKAAKAEPVRGVLLPTPPDRETVLDRMADIVAHLGADRQIPIVVFTLGTPREELVMKVLSAISGVDFRRMRRRLITSEDWQTMQKAAEPLAKAPVFIDDSPDLTLQQLAQSCRTLKESHDIRYVFIAARNLPGPASRTSRQARPDNTMRTLNALAGELSLSVILFF